MKFDNTPTITEHDDRIFIRTHHGQIMLRWDGVQFEMQVSDDDVNTKAVVAHFGPKTLADLAYGLGRVNAWRMDAEWRKAWAPMLSPQLVIEQWNDGENDGWF